MMEFSLMQALAGLLFKINPWHSMLDLRVCNITLHSVDNRAGDFILVEINILINHLHVISILFMEFRIDK